MSKYDFTFRSISDNLYKVFGTYNPFAILSPSLRNVPFTGIEWSFQLRDLGFNEKGELATNNFDEEDTLVEKSDAPSELEMSEIHHRTGGKDVLDSIDS